MGRMDKIETPEREQERRSEQLAYANGAEAEVDQPGLGELREAVATQARDSCPTLPGWRAAQHSGKTG